MTFAGGSDGPDLRAAVQAGFFVLGVAGLGRVESEGALLRYDPDMPRDERARQVAEEIVARKPANLISYPALKKNPR